MIKFLDILREAKQVGPLYHFTSYGSMAKIVDEDLTLDPKIQYKRSSYLSFTRNKHMKSSSISSNVRITVDGDKLSEKYKIEPYADTKAGYGRNNSDESEERIYVRDLPNGVNISKALISIDILDINQTIGYNVDDDFEEEYGTPMLSDYNNLIRLLKLKNIPYNIVKKY